MDVSLLHRGSERGTSFVPLSPIRQAIVTEASEWEGTPYQHRQHCKLVGADCVGYPLGVCINCHLLPEDIEVPYYSVQWHLHQGYELLAETVVRFGCKEKVEAALLPGDIILFKIGLVCSHTGILLPQMQFAHAVCPSPSRVIIRPYDGVWRKKLAKRFFSLPGVED